jgi:hypothetical protein
MIAVGFVVASLLIFESRCTLIFESEWHTMADASSGIRVKANVSDLIVQPAGMGSWGIRDGELCTVSTNSNVQVIFNNQFTQAGTLDVVVRRTKRMQEMLVDVNGMFSLSLADYDGTMKLVQSYRKTIFANLSYPGFSTAPLSFRFLWSNYLNETTILLNSTEIFSSGPVALPPANDSREGNGVFGRFASGFCIGKVRIYDEQQSVMVMSSTTTSVTSQSSTPTSSSSNQVNVTLSSSLPLSSSIQLTLEPISSEVASAIDSDHVRTRPAQSNDALNFLWLLLLVPVLTLVILGALWCRRKNHGIESALAPRQRRPVNQYDAVDSKFVV